MSFLVQLWLPILVSAVFVFVVSSIFHMALPFHRTDFRKMKPEEAVMNALGADIEPGCYRFPWADTMKEMCTPEMTEKVNRGPVGWLTVVPKGGVNLGSCLILWFLYCILVGVFVAYVGWHALGAGASYLAVFRIAGACAMLGYAVCRVDDSIWKGVGWGTTFKFIIDGVVYALVTAGTFGWLWPAAA